MPSFPVVDRKNNCIVYLDTKDVLLVKFARDGNIIIAEGNNQYREFHVLDDWSLFLKPEGFEWIDRGNIVNMNKIEAQKNQYVFFNPPYNIKENQVYSTVSRTYINKVTEILKNKK
ncbi:LytTR family transcriptional regulator DNA-binding domain-containing protein [Brevibacillus laterosporus]|uniref:LytTR family transcriptional regulator DNA-binding domain-containing protein n=1 Tax=Brevibacillus laterosporus TaxID=1465 RepID=UPI0003B18155|nr:LytTR family transcriptional regulator DNA-binding domain-containing protein [Brevibacillus laterosporus]ERM18992.1 hypothetical protein P615_13945 [Brevibacillus laterosporus PE36]